MPISSFSAIASFASHSMLTRFAPLSTFSNPLCEQEEVGIVRVEKHMNGATISTVCSVGPTAGTRRFTSELLML